MKIFRSFEEASGIRNPVVTTGSFDGVHAGHKTILQRLAKLAEKYHGESVLITFDPHPRKVLYPDTAGKDLKLINTQEEKLYLLRKAGLDNLLIINFTLQFSRITSEEFIREYLHKILRARVIVAGFNHHFGFNQEGNYRQLWGWKEKYGFEAEEIPEKEIEHETVSSTRIRKAVADGYIQRANAYLDHYYMIMGETCDNSITTIPGFPEMMRMIITDDSKLLPAPGIYAVTAERDGFSSKAMALIMDAESIPHRILVNIFNDAAGFKNTGCKLLFHKKIHGSLHLSEKDSSEKVINARKEISELIY